MKNYFGQFCIALVMECVFQKHGRKIVADSVMTDFLMDRVLSSVINLPDASASVPTVH